MALPKLETPIYELELPSTGKKIKYRPFLVKEHKNLMIALESEEETQLRDSLASIISGCTFNKIDPFEVPMFDIEFMFLRIRGKSVGEKVKLNVLCPDDNKTRVDVEINLGDINVHMKAEHTNEVSVTDDIKIIMRYPSLNDIVDIKDNQEIDQVFSMIKRCVNEVHEGETIHRRVDMSEKDLEEFIGNLTTETFEKLGNFFETMPKVMHVMKIKNPKTKKTGEVVIEGIQNFFG